MKANYYCIYCKKDIYEWGLCFECKEKFEKERRKRELEQEQFDTHNDTDGFGNCFSDADPGL